MRREGRRERGRQTGASLIPHQGRNPKPPASGLTWILGAGVSSVLGWKQLRLRSDLFRSVFYIYKLSTSVPAQCFSWLRRDKYLQPKHQAFCHIFQTFSRSQEETRSEPVERSCHKKKVVRAAGRAPGRAWNCMNMRKRGGKELSTLGRAETPQPRWFSLSLSHSRKTCLLRLNLSEETCKERGVRGRSLSAGEQANQSDANFPK